MSRKTICLLLRASGVILVVLALATLFPHAGPTVSDLGYFTFCPFAPWSTVTLLLLAALGWIVRRHIESLPPSEAK
jgi:hypothetical protein